MLGDRVWTNTGEPKIRYTFQERSILGITGAPLRRKVRKNEEEVRTLSPSKTKPEKNNRITITAEVSPLGLSLGELLGQPTLTPNPASPEKSERSEPAPAPPPPSFSRVVLQRTRAGRGGKWVIRVLLTPAPTAAQLEALARDLRRSLGTGAHTEEGALVVQGDIADRIGDWFRKQGVLKIVR